MVRQRRDGRANELSARSYELRWYHVLPRASLALVSSRENALVGTSGENQSFQIEKSLL